MYTKILINPASGRAVMLSSHHKRSKTRSERPRASVRAESVFGSKSYADGVQRAFNDAKTKIFFNPDMRFFVTLTYKGKSQTIDDVMYDLKMFLKKQKRKTGENLKYIWVAEYQKRGSIHVHMITNGQFITHINKNGYQSITDWTHGYSSVLTIDDFDNNFRPYLYLFKYMRKAQRIGKSFVHASRNISLSNCQKLELDEFDLEKYYVMNQERTVCYPDELKNPLSFYHYFLVRDNLDSGEVP